MDFDATLLDIIWGLSFEVPHLINRSYGTRLLTKPQNGVGRGLQPTTRGVTQSCKSTSIPGRSSVVLEGSLYLFLSTWKSLDCGGFVYERSGHG